MSLKAIGVPSVIVKWIEVCISTTHFSVAMNGESHGFFPSLRGFRQGNPFVFLFVCSSYKGFQIYY